MYRDKDFKNLSNLIEIFTSFQQKIYQISTWIVQSYLFFSKLSIVHILRETWSWDEFSWTSNNFQLLEK